MSAPCPQIPHEAGAVPTYAGETGFQVSLPVARGLPSLRLNWRSSVVFARVGSNPYINRQ